MKYYPMPLHIHSVWERNASMEGHFYNAQKLGIHHMYITDHDCRMGRRQHPVDSFDFSKGSLMISNEDNSLWHGFTVKVQDAGTAAVVENGALQMTACGAADDWTTVSVEFDSSAKRHECALLSKVFLNLGMQIPTLGDDARVVVDIKLSLRPPEFEFGHILYVFGNTDGLENPYAAVVPMETEGSHMDYVLNLLQDAHKVGGGDNVLNTISFSVAARRGANASLSLDKLHIQNELTFDAGRAEQQRLANEMGAKYGITPFITSEISQAGKHKICFSTKVPIIDYEALNYQVTGQDAIRHVQLHGGIFSGNHPFDYHKNVLRSADVDQETKETIKQQVIDEFLENRAWGASMLEVGFPMGRGGAEFQDHLRLWDTLSAAGVFISGYGDSDTHGKLGWFDSNNFVGYIAAEEPCEEAFIESMLSGNLYTGDPVYLQHAQVDFQTDLGCPMGGITLKAAPETAQLTLIGFPDQCEVVFVANGSAVKKDTFSGSYQGGVLLPTDQPFNFVRAEVYKDNRCILLTNPIYHMTLFENDVAQPGCDGRFLYHIGDIDREHLPVKMNMIARLRPDVLVNTGDLIDDLKVGRRPEDIPDYEIWMPRLVHWMERHAKEVYIVPGNNDLPDLIKETAQKSTIVPANTCLKIDGLDFNLCHWVARINGEAKIYLYGHGLTGDNYEFHEGEKTYCNVIRGDTIVYLKDGHCFRLRPEIEPI